MEHSLARIRGAVWLGLVGKGRVRSLGMNGKGEQRERVGKCIIIARDFIFGFKCAKKCLAAGLHPDPLRELEHSPGPPNSSGCECSPRPPNRSGCHGREHSLVQIRGPLRRERGVEVSGRGGDE